MTHEDATIRNLAETVKHQGIELDGVIRRLDVLAEAFVHEGARPEFPASELLTIGTGPARVEFMVYDDPDALEFALMNRLHATEADGWTVESVQFAMQRDEYGACILFRLPVPEEGESR